MCLPEILVISMNERLWELLAKYWAGRISSEEKAEMERMLLEHPDHWLKTGLMQQIGWSPEQMLSKKQADRIADRIVGKSHGREPGSWNDKTAYQRGGIKSRVRYWKLAIVTVFILFCSTFILLFLSRSAGDYGGTWQQVATTYGMRTTMRLADGSKLWLNSGSTLRYPQSFNRKLREVYLTGEAYFKIAYQAAKPFMIHTGDMDIRVLSGEFDVRAYGNEDDEEILLVSGAGQVTMNGDPQGQAVSLKPNQKIIVRHVSPEANDGGGQGPGNRKASPFPGTGITTRSMLLEPVSLMAGDLIPETAWKEDILVFNDEPLWSVARRLEKWYGVSIDIQDSLFARQRFTGRADHASLEQALHLLQMIKPFQYVIQGNQVQIR